MPGAEWFTESHGAETHEAQLQGVGSERPDGHAGRVGRGRVAVVAAVALALVATATVAVGVATAGTAPQRRDAASGPIGPTPGFGTAQVPASPDPDETRDQPTTEQPPTGAPATTQPAGPTTAAGGAVVGRATPSGASGPRIDYPTFSNAKGLRLNGSARVTGGRIVLGSGQGSAGSVWSTTPIDLTRPFSSRFTADISKITDGIAFVIQSQSPTALGSAGGGLGYGHRPGDSGPAIAPSAAVELDTWDNGPDGFDPPGQHVAVTTNGDVTRHLTSRTPRFSLFGAGPVDVVVVYNGGGHLLTVYVTPYRMAILGAAGYQLAPLFTYSIDLGRLIGAGPAYVGFTGGTGYTTVTDPEESINSWVFTQL